MPVEYIAEVPEYQIIDGVMHVQSGDWCVAMSLRTFKRGLARSQRVIRDYETRKADLIAFERKVGGHAARS